MLRKIKYFSFSFFVTIIAFTFVIGLITVDFRSNKYGFEESKPVILLHTVNNKMYINYNFLGNSLWSDISILKVIGEYKSYIIPCVPVPAYMLIALHADIIDRFIVY